jgi:Xaa-Pro aminopeptidase
MDSSNSANPAQAVPLAELTWRHRRCREALAHVAPAAGGLLVFSPRNLYYLAGTLASGVMWLPREGEPVLLCRRGLERARLESPLGQVLPFRSFRELPGILAGAGSPLSATAAAETGGLSWTLGEIVRAHLAGSTLVSGDRALAAAREVKSPWELERLRRGGATHGRALAQLLPARIRPGMSEREIAGELSAVLWELGNLGVPAMETSGSEAFLSLVAAGEHANHPVAFNGPVGLRGEHPAMPHLGHAGTLWRRGEPLVVDAGFVCEGYHTDKTQVYFAGGAAELSPGAARAHEFCVQVHAWCAEQLRPGGIPSEIAAHCFAWAEREGFAEGFMALGGNKVGFVGHGIGLALDETPVITKGFDAPLEEGMVIALEPKLGIPGFGMVGLENTFEVTAAGGRSLTGEVTAIVCVEG